MSKASKSQKNQELKRDDISDIALYYESNLEEQRTARQKLEYLVTVQLIHQYLPKDANVLEIGAAAGQFTAVLAQSAKKTVALDLSERLIGINKKVIEHLKLEKKVVHIAQDVRDFWKDNEETFDVVLLMGPLYHLANLEERESMLYSARKCLSKKGLLISTHLSRMGYISYSLARDPAQILSIHREVPRIWTDGHIENHPRGGQFRGYFTTLPEIKSLHQKTGFDLFAMHSQDPAIGGVDELFNRLPENIQLEWAKFLFLISDDPFALGSGRSLFCVAQSKT